MLRRVPPHSGHGTPGRPDGRSPPQSAHVVDTDSPLASSRPPTSLTRRTSVSSVRVRAAVQDRALRVPRDVSSAHCCTRRPTARVKTWACMTRSSSFSASTGPTAPLRQGPLGTERPPGHRRSLGRPRQSHRQPPSLRYPEDRPSGAGRGTWPADPPATDRRHRCQRQDRWRRDERAGRAHR